VQTKPRKTCQVAGFLQRVSDNLKIPKNGFAFDADSAPPIFQRKSITMCFGFFAG
jgi:hypothetical protein